MRRTRPAWFGAKPLHAGQGRALEAANHQPSDEQLVLSAAEDRYEKALEEEYCQPSDDDCLFRDVENRYAGSLDEDFYEPSDEQLSPCEVESLHDDEASDRNDDDALSDIHHAPAGLHVSEGDNEDNDQVADDVAGRAPRISPATAIHDRLDAQMSVSGGGTFARVFHETSLSPLTLERFCATLQPAGRPKDVASSAVRRGQVVIKKVLGG
ncbi:hypothetical protein Q5752_003759 [Cryptotrichosporon argae]